MAVATPVQTEYDATRLVGAIRALAARCDGASSLDGQGFSGTDAKWGKRLAELPASAWSPGDTYDAWRRLRKYASQLEAYGCPYDAIPMPPDPSDSYAGNVWREGNTWVVSFRYDPLLVEAIKYETQGRRFYPPTKRWHVDCTIGNARALQSICKRFHLWASLDAFVPVTATDVALKQAEQVRQEIRGAVRMTASQFVVSWPYDPSLLAAFKETTNAVWGREFDKDGKVQRNAWLLPRGNDAAAALLKFLDGRTNFEVEPDALAELERLARLRSESLLGSSAMDAADIHVPGITGQLRGYQASFIGYCRQSQEAHGFVRLFLCDDMGTGKTIMALSLREDLDANKMLVICPASVKYQWLSELRKWVPHRRVQVIEGRKNAHLWADTVIVNYDLLTAHQDVLKDHGFGLVICDETHYLKGKKSKRTQAATAIVKSATHRLLMSGTPILNNVEELESQLGIVGRFDIFKSRDKFYWNYVKYDPWKDRGRPVPPNLDWAAQQEWIKESIRLRREDLNEKLRANHCYVRRTKDQVMTELPALQRVDVGVALDNEDAYRLAEGTFAFAGELGEDTTGNDAETGHAIKASWHELQRILVDGKIGPCIRWLTDWHANNEDNKIIVFCWHRRVVEQAAKEFNAPMIYGGMASKDRQAVVDAFMRPDGPWLVVCNILAAGEGLNMQAASYVAFFEQGWNPARHEQAEARAHRMGQTEQVTAYYLLAHDTIDDDRYDLVWNVKAPIVRDVIEGDGDAVPQGRLTAELVRRIQARHPELMAQAAERRAAKRAAAKAAKEAAKGVGQ